jgi:hypothetical protein
MGVPRPLTPESVAEYVISVLQASGSTPYIGEPISQLQHSLQCGQLAATASPPVDKATQLAAPLHDIGQFAPAADLRAFFREHGWSRRYAERWPGGPRDYRSPISAWTGFPRQGSAPRLRS